jgi:small redox-active disulfide protein 2
VKEEVIEAEVIKITDMDEIISRGVMMTPAVFVDGKLVSSGKVPSREDIRKWLNG